MTDTNSAHDYSVCGDHCKKKLICTTCFVLVVTSFIIALMPGLFVTGQASCLGGIWPSQRSDVCDSRSRAARPCQQIVMTVNASFIPHRVQDFFLIFLEIVTAAEVVFVGTLGATIYFGRNIGKIVFLWRQVALHALDTDTILAGGVFRNLPTPVCALHFVALAAAIL